MNSSANVDKDMEAIERLHQTDMRASKAGDFATLRSLMTDDAVILPPGGNVLRGKVELDANMAQMEQAMSQVEVLEYVEEFEEVKILGEYAYEWGEIRGAMRAKSGGEVERSSYKVMRVLQRQPDGGWKVHRSIWNANASGAGQE